MTEKRYSHDAIVIIDHLKRDLIYIDGKDELLELAEYVDKIQEENEQLKQKLKLKKKNELKEAIDRIDSLIHTQEDYLAWSIIYETLTDGKPLDYRLKM